MTIREATPDDLALIGSIIGTPGVDAQSAMVRNLAGRNCFVLIDLDGTIPRGFLVARQHFRQVVDHPGWYIDRIVVGERFRDAGIGSDLQRECLTRLKELGVTKAFMVSRPQDIGFDTSNQFGWVTIATGGQFQYKNIVGRRFHLRQTNPQELE